MIKYSLKCPRDHSFDSWFANAQAYDTLAKSGMVTCAVCGSDGVTKAIMAPRVSSGSAQPPEAPTANSPKKDAPSGPLTAPASPAEQALRELRAHVEANSEYVGKSFVKEARAIHEGEAPERPIYGEAKIEDAKALVAEGIEVAPLPFRPDRKTN
ncbi:DUF1178 family protein [Alphaproteobacteria bacterium KMM 3653]|uniref:DUF1178 family protein n=1 Tax=Harenicola maris TaxID=2841044 RepID=A0AAP2CKP8_9RHOB|nr:DUF1178 family protein [Harenicola maris]